MKRPAWRTTSSPGLAESSAFCRLPPALTLIVLPVTGVAATLVWRNTWGIAGDLGPLSAAGTRSPKGSMPQRLARTADCDSQKPSEEWICMPLRKARPYRKKPICMCAAEGRSITDSPCVALQGPVRWTQPNGAAMSLNWRPQGS